MNHQSKVHRSLLLAVFVLGVATSPVMAGADEPALTVTNESRISVNVDKQPLNVLLRMMAEKKLFNISGGAAGAEFLTLHFSNLTLPEALSKMLRGYNYVVIDRGKNQPPVLAVMGKIEKGAVAAHAQAPAPAPAMPEPRSYAPPEPEPAPPVTVVTPQPGMSARQPAARPQMPQEARPGGEAQRQQAGQPPPAGQPARQAEAPPAESPGVHF